MTDGNASYEATWLTVSFLRPVALAGAAWLLLRLCRIRHPASQHTVWTGVAAGMLLLPFLSGVAPQYKLPVLPEQHASSPARVSEALSKPLDSDPPTPGAEFHPAQQDASGFKMPSLTMLVIWIYLTGLLCRLVYRAIGWMMLRRLIANSRILHRRVRESDDVIAPVTAGVLHPAVILPAGWRQWNSRTRRAILAHEFAHIRRNDGLTSMLARWITCLFWYHPVAWLVARRISETAESACDAEALKGLRDPAGYSRLLLAFAERVNLAGHRVAIPGLAMTGFAASSAIAKRIDRVFELSNGNLRRLYKPRVVIAVLGTPLLCLAATAGLGERGLSLPYFPPPTPAAPMLAQAQGPAPEPPRPQPNGETPQRSLSELMASQIPSAPGLYLDQDLEEYHQRQAYGDEHFSFAVAPGSVHILRGSFSARGQAYVRFGAPDSIEDHSGTAGTPAYQLWRYAHTDAGANIAFEFVDSAGTGEYSEAVGPGLPGSYLIPGDLGRTTVTISLHRGVGPLRVSGRISSATQPIVTTFEEAEASGTLTKTVSLAPGTYTLTVELRDPATGIASSSEHSFQVN